ncbi:MAG: hypothetical protein H7318_14265 [Oligoflexus sp.]|nr:hypothetical protein [Oligoflexus sp.]
MSAKVSRAIKSLDFIASKVLSVTARDLVTRDRWVNVLFNGDKIGLIENPKNVPYNVPAGWSRDPEGKRAIDLTSISNGDDIAKRVATILGLSASETARFLEKAEDASSFLWDYYDVISREALGLRLVPEALRVIEKGSTHQDVCEELDGLDSQGYISGFNHCYQLERLVLEKFGKRWSPRQYG